MLTRIWILVLVFLATAVTLSRFSRTEPFFARAPLATLPTDLGEWQGRPAPPFDDETLAVLGVDDYLTRTYVRAGAAVGLYIGYWASQRQGDTMHSPLNCLPGSGWEPLSKRDLSLHVSDSATGERRIAVNRYLVERAGDRELVLYWYQSHGRVVANEYLSRIYLVTDAIGLRRTDAALVRVIVHAPSDAAGEAEAERAGVAFVTTLFPWLGQSLPS